MIDVAFTRRELRRSDVAVVVDVLRATSTATQALAAGYRRILCADSIERARSLRAPDRVLAGERGCVRPPGFDQGNSPREATRARGFELVLATTNGAPTIVAAAAHAADVLLGSLLNLDALIAELRNRVDPPEADIQIVCSGTDGAPALEDVYVAGRISAALSGARSDSARIAEAVARAFTAPRAALGASADAAILCANGMAADIDYCARTSELDHVPVVAAASAGVASVVSCQRFDRHRRVGATRPPERAVTAPRSAAPHRAGMR